MNILYIAPPVYPVSAKTGGSVEIAIYQIAKRIAKTHRVTVLSRRGAGLPSLRQEGQLTIQRIPGGLHYLKRAISLAKRRSFDCIQVDNRPQYIPMLRRAFPRTPIILALHSLTFLNFLNDKQKKNVIRSSDAVVCNSQFITDYYRNQFPQYKHKFRTIYLGVDLERFRLPAPEERQQELQKMAIRNTFNILYVGRVIPDKGVHLLVEAVGMIRKEHPDIRLLVIGNCKNKMYKRKLQEEAKRHNLRMHLIGGISPATIHRAYWLGDCFVCPTQFKEAFGLVNVEAMASGVPVIASSRGGIPEIIEDGTGILVQDYTNPLSFASSIQQIIRSPERATELTLRAQEKVQTHFSWDQTAKNYEAIYHELVAKQTT